MNLITPSYGLGPKLPAIEGGQKIIEEVVQKITALLSAEGLEIGKYAKIKGNDSINLKITAHPSGGGLRVELLSPQPRLNLMGWLKSNIIGITVSPKLLKIEMNGFPDLEVEVKS